MVPSPFACQGALVTSQIVTGVGIAGAMKSGYEPWRKVPGESVCLVDVRVRVRFRFRFRVHP